MHMPKSRAATMEGWKERMLTKLALAGGTGVAVGSLLAVLNHMPLVRYTASSTASFVLVMGCFSAMQETARFLRNTDSVANSVLAGGATGALLYKIHSHRPMHGLVICSALAGAAHWASDKVDLSHGLRSALVSMDLLDADDSSTAGAAQLQQGEGGGEPEGGLWHRMLPYLPMRKLSDEEWEQYQREKEEQQRKRVEVALEGGLPAVLAKQQRQQPEEQNGSAAGSQK